MQLLVDNADERQLSLDARTRYLGIERRNLPLQELQALTEQQMNQMLDIALQVEMHEAIIPPPLAMQLPGLASQGVVVQDGSRWRSVLNASGDEVVLNGETISVAVLKQRLEAAVDWLALPGMPRPSHRTGSCLQKVVQSSLALSGHVVAFC